MLVLPTQKVIIALRGMYNVHNYVIEGYLMVTRNCRIPLRENWKDINFHIFPGSPFREITLTVFLVVLNGPTPVVKERSGPETVINLINLFEDLLMRSLNKYSGS